MNSDSINRCGIADNERSNNYSYRFSQETNMYVSSFVENSNSHPKLQDLSINKRRKDNSVSTLIQSGNHGGLPVPPGNNNFNGRPYRQFGTTPAQDNFPETGHPAQDSFDFLATRRVPTLQRYCYAVGHIQNDMCMSMWYTYLLLYYKEVIGLPPINAANLLLLGQLCDGLATPIVGMYSDKINVKFYTKRKFLHLVGTICVTLSFPFIFRPASINAEPTDLAYTIWYIPFICIFQIAWGAIQISHLSLVPELTEVDTDKHALVSMRFACLILANVYVYFMTSLFINKAAIKRNKSAQLDDSISMEVVNDLQTSHQDVFEMMSVLCVVTGILFTLLFHFFVKERQSVKTVKPTITQTGGHIEKDESTFKANNNYENQNTESLLIFSRSHKRSEPGSDSIRKPLSPAGDHHGDQCNKVPAHATSTLSPIAENKQISQSKQSTPERKNHSKIVIKQPTLEILSTPSPSRCDKCKKQAASNSSNSNGKKVNVTNISCPANHFFRPVPQLTIWQWLKRVDFYAVAVLYGCARLVGNLLMVYSPFYVIYTLRLEEAWLARLPLLLYLAGFLITFLVKVLCKYNVAYPYFLGIFLTIAGCVSVLFLSKDNMPLIITTFIIFGFGSNAMVCSGLEIITDMIQNNSDTAGFVFGFNSLTEKVLNGFAVILIETFVPCSQRYNQQTSEFYNWKNLTLAPHADLFESSGASEIVSGKVPTEIPVDFEWDFKAVSGSPSIHVTYTDTEFVMLKSGEKALFIKKLGIGSSWNKTIVIDNVTYDNSSLGTSLSSSALIDTFEPNTLQSCEKLQFPKIFDDTNVFSDRIQLEANQDTHHDLTYLHESIYYKKFMSIGLGTISLLGLFAALVKVKFRSNRSVRA